MKREREREREREVSSIEIFLKKATLFLTDIHELFNNAKLKTVPPNKRHVAFGVIQLLIQS